jgi:hypothetical protein
MRIISTTLLALLLAAPFAFAQVVEETETYLVAPQTMNKRVTVVTTDGKKVEGKVVSGDDDKIVVQPTTGSPVDVPTGRIVTVHFRRPRRSAKVDLAGNLIGGIGLGIGGAQLGKHVAESVRGDDLSNARRGPIVGGVLLGFVGGHVGREIARHAATEEVTLKVSEGVSGQAPKVGAITLPAPPADSAGRVQPVDLRR